MVVLDASVAAKAVLTEVGTGAVVDLLRGDDRFVAPSIIRFEVSGAVLRRLRKGEMEEEPARLACEDWHAMLDEATIGLVPMYEVYAEALELAFRLKHALFDCLYLATAIRLDAVLLTTDEAFFKRAGKLYNKVKLFPKAA